MSHRLIWALYTARTALATRRFEERGDRGEVTSSVIIAVGLAILAAAIVVGLTVWANGKMATLP